MIAEASFGIEPIYGLVYIKEVLEKNELLYVNRYFEEEAQKMNIYSKDLMRKIAQAGGSIQKMREIPEALRKRYVTTEDITPQWHVRIQAAFQKHVDNGISKTINFPANATIDDVKKAYLLAYKLDCKGITIYRNTSRMVQVLRHPDITEKDKQIKLPFDESSKNKGVKSVKERGAKEVIPPPPVESDAISEEQIRAEREVRTSTKRCPSCSQKAEYSEGCLLCLHCGFSIAVVS
jgi:ribonucleoside-diphosphate reductase alpha chain